MERVEKLTLKKLVQNPELYVICDVLTELPLPDTIKIGRSRYYIPEDLTEFSANICYGQKMFLTEEAENDFDIIVRVMDGYYYPIVTGKPFNDDSLLINRTYFHYNNKTTDLYYRKLKFKFLFIKIYDKKITQKSISECGKTQTKTIDIVKK